MIGLLKYGLRIDDENELVGGISGLQLTDMINKIHEKQINEIESLVIEQEVTWLEVVLN